MATPEEVRALLAVSCPWCSAEIGQRCFVRYGKTLGRITTLDGECHEARWQRALSRSARVLIGATDRLQGREDRAEPRLSTIGETATAVLDRPW